MQKALVQYSVQVLFLYNENPQFNWGFKKLKAMGRKK